MAIIKKILLFVLVAFSATIYAAVPQWQIIPESSRLTFKGTQNNAPASGEFKKFDGTIKFDPDNVSEGEVIINIDMNSIYTNYADMTNTLISNDWFAVKLFPTAVFKANQFKKLDADHYQAIGTLTIKNKSVPITLAFTKIENANGKAQVKGETSLKRTAFGVGTGEWGDTETVKDDVKVEFTLNAKQIGK